GGPDGSRRRILMNAIHARSQLRYWPTSERNSHVNTRLSAGSLELGELLAPSSRDARSRSHQSRPACLIVNVGPRTLMVPTRAGPPAAFAATLKRTVPLPAPLAPVSAIHESVDEALHGHVSTVSTTKLPMPPSAEKSCDDGVSV